ncbi:MAG: DUF4199 domain-containing protein [Bacteroidales bacterium]
MEQNIEVKKKVSVVRNAINYGVLLGIVLIIADLLFYMLNVSTDSIFRYLNFVLIIVGLTVGILNYRNQINEGIISYEKSLGSGVLIGLFASVIVAIYMVIFLKFIDPGMIDEMLRKAEEKMLEKNPSMSDEDIETAMKYTKMFINPVWMSIWSIIGSTFMSFIASLIISIFTKKKDNSFESNFR